MLEFAPFNFLKKYFLSVSQPDQSRDAIDASNRGSPRPVSQLDGASNRGEPFSETLIAAEAGAAA